MTGTGEARFARAGDGTVLQYEVAGAGEPIVFLHGGFASRSAFARQREGLRDEFTAILRDLRGHGGSTCTIPADYAIDTTEVTDLLAVLDAEGIERAHLVGHSTGGVIAFCFGLAHPERTGRLVLLEPSLVSLMPPDVYETGWRPLTDAVARAKAQSSQAALGEIRKLILGDGWETHVRPSILARMEAILDISLAQAQALDRLAVTEAELMMLRVPALLLYAEHSLPIEPFIAERLRRVRPDLRQMFIANAGHNMHIDQPEQVNRAIQTLCTVDRKDIRVVGPGEGVRPGRRPSTASTFEVAGGIAGDPARVRAAAARRPPCASSPDLEKPDAGEVYVGGQLLTSAARAIFLSPEKRHMGMVFQTYAIWPHMSVFENIAFPLREKRMPSARSASA